MQTRQPETSSVAIAAEDLIHSVTTIDGDYSGVPPEIVRRTARRVKVNVQTLQDEIDHQATAARR